MDRRLVLPMIGYQKWVATNDDSPRGFFTGKYHWRPIEQYVEQSAFLGLSCRWITLENMYNVNKNKSVDVEVHQELSTKAGSLTESQAEKYYEDALGIPVKKSRRDSLAFPRLTSAKIRKKYGRDISETLAFGSLPSVFFDFGTGPRKRTSDPLDPLSLNILQHTQFREDLVAKAFSAVEQIGGKFVAVHARRGQISAKCETILEKLEPEWLVGKQSDSENKSKKKRCIASSIKAIERILTLKIGTPEVLFTQRRVDTVEEAQEYERQGFRIRPKDQHVDSNNIPRPRDSLAREEIDFSDLLEEGEGREESVEISADKNFKLGVEADDADPLSLEDLGVDKAPDEIIPVNEDNPNNGVDFSPETDKSSENGEKGSTEDSRILLEKRNSSVLSKIYIVTDDLGMKQRTRTEFSRLSANLGPAWETPIFLSDLLSNGTIFEAHSNQDRFVNWRAKGIVDERSSISDPVELGILELLICMEAEVFVGNRYSSFSREIIERRSIKGKKSHYL